MKSHLVLLILIILFAPFAGCEENHVKVELKGDGVNTCLIDALVYKSAYDTQTQLKQFTYSKILLIKWRGNKNGVNGHALTVFVVNTHSFPNPIYDKLYVFDREGGSRQIPIRLKDKALFTAIYLYGDKVEKAWFLE